MKTITIGIPTYQRCSELQATLDAMIAEGIHAMPGVEIMVRDNGSQDGTYAMLADYKRRYGVQISKNARNLGMNENIGGLLLSCTTDYFVLTADEDPIRRAPLQRLLDLIQDQSFAYACTVFMNEGQVYRGRLEGAERIDPTHFHHCSFYISGLVFHTALAQSVWPALERFVYDRRCAYPQTFLACALLARYGCYYLPLELAYILNKSETNDLGEYWLPQARMDQNAIRQEFLTAMAAASTDPNAREAYAQMARVQVYR
jgi:glycosyltransferase involved in cell wall biosynthesis